MGKQLPTCALILAALAGLGPGPISQAKAADPGARSHAGLPHGLAKPSTVALVLDRGLLDPDLRLRLEAGLHEALEPVLERGSSTLVAPGAPGERTIRVEVVSFDGDQRDYELELRLSDGDGVERSPAIVCEACSEARLIAALSEQVVELLARVDATEGARAPEPGPQRIDGPAREPLCPGQRLCALGLHGASLLGLGLGASITGAALLARGVDSSPSRSTVQDFRGPGATVLAIGAVAASVGATLLIIDLHRQARTRRLSLRAAPTYLGLSLQF